MTTNELNKVKIGTRVIWSAPGDSKCSGYVSKRPDFNNTAPHYVIDWADGQTTDGRDSDALAFVEVDT